MKLLATLTICSLVLSVFIPASAAGWDIDLTIEGEVLSARLMEVYLKAILEKLERERGIWFKGNSSLLDERITVQFTDLPLEEGLNRILAPLNYSLVFDRNGRVVGVIAVARGTVDRPVSEVRTGDSQRTPSSPAANERDTANRPVTDPGKKTLQGSYTNGMKESREDFTVKRNCPPPSSRVKASKAKSENFSVIRDSGPPGNAGEATPQDHGGFTIIKNCSAPGGPVEISTEQREKYKVVENCPPPGN